VPQSGLRDGPESSKSAPSGRGVPGESIEAPSRSPIWTQLPSFSVHGWEINPSPLAPHPAAPNANQATATSALDLSPQ
jgi:hypothetical protein